MSIRTEIRVWLLWVVYSAIAAYGAMSAVAPFYPLGYVDAYVAVAWSAAIAKLTAVWWRMDEQAQR